MARQLHPKFADRYRRHKDVPSHLCHGVPDLKLTIKDAFGAGDKVCTRWLAEGTNTGSFDGHPPTGRRICVEGITIDRFDDAGKIVETWNSWDTHGFLVQLGLAAEEGEKPSTQARREQQPGVQ